MTDSSAITLPPTAQDTTAYVAVTIDREAALEEGYSVHGDIKGTINLAKLSEDTRKRLFAAAPYDAAERLYVMTHRRAETHRTTALAAQTDAVRILRSFTGFGNNPSKAVKRDVDEGLSFPDAPAYPKIATLTEETFSELLDYWEALNAAIDEGKLEERALAAIQANIDLIAEAVLAADEPSKTATLSSGPRESSVLRYGHDSRALHHILADHPLYKARAEKVEQAKQASIAHYEQLRAEQKQKREEKEAAEKAEEAARKAQLDDAVARLADDLDKARWAEGVMDEDEAINIVRQEAWAQIEVPFERFKKMTATEVCEAAEKSGYFDSSEITPDNVCFSTRTGEDVEVIPRRVYKVLKSLRETAKALPYPTAVDIVEHYGDISRSEWELTRHAVRLTITFGAFTFSREYQSD